MSIESVYVMLQQGHISVDISTCNNAVCSRLKLLINIGLYIHSVDKPPLMYLTCIKQHCIQQTLDYLIIANTQSQVHREETISFSFNSGNLSEVVCLRKAQCIFLLMAPSYELFLRQVIQEHLMMNIVLKSSGMSDILNYTTVTHIIQVA